MLVDVNWHNEFAVGVPEFGFFLDDGLDEGMAELFFAFVTVDDEFAAGNFLFDVIGKTDEALAVVTGVEEYDSACSFAFGTVREDD